MIFREATRSQLIVHVLDLLNRYKDLAILQKERLLQGDVEGALQPMQEKEQILAEMDRFLRENTEGWPLESPNSFPEEIVQEILSINIQVVEMMEQQKERIGRELQKIQQGQRTQKAYRTRYTPGAYFFDKKK